MRQLALFEGTPPPPEPEPEATPPSAPPVTPDVVLRGQLDLFGARTLALGKVREHIGRAELTEARAHLQEIRQRVPFDADLLMLSDRVSALEKQLRAADDDPLALATIARGQEAREPWTALSRTLLREAASTTIALRGDGADIGGKPPGALFVEAGAYADGVASLERALTRGRTARLLFPLADALYERGETALSRRTYLEALLEGATLPFLYDVHDPAVRELRRVCEIELEIEEDPVAFAAVAGLLTGVLPRVDAKRPPFDALVAKEAAAGPLGKARACVYWMFEAMRAKPGSQVAVSARGRLKRLSPTTFEAFAERVLGIARP